MQRLDGVQTADRHGFLAGQTQRFAGVAICELERNNAHAHKVRTVDTFKVFSDHGLDAQQRRTLGRPVTGRARAILFAAKDHQRCVGVLIGHRRVKDRRLFAIGALGIAALDAVQHFVLDADVGECAAHHHLVVAATRPVRVEFAHRNLTFHQILTGRRAFLERPGRRDVVGGDHVTQNRQHFGVLDVADRARFLAHVLEIGRVLHIGRLRRPVIGHAVRHFDALPLFVAFEDVRILLLEGGACHGFLDQFRNLLGRGPDVFQVDVIAVLVLPQHTVGGCPTGSTCRSGHSR